MNEPARRYVLIASLVLAAGGWVVRAAAAMPETAGRVAQLAGRAMAASPAGRVRPLAKGSVVRSGETVVTYPFSYVRLKLTDRSAVLLRPNTRFQIESYRMSKRPAKRRGFFSLLRGGFRYVTGLIGHTVRRNYRVRVATATIGIRGTDYAVRLCDGDCAEYGADTRDGVYVRLEHNDGVEICSGGPECVVLDQAGQETYIDFRGTPEQTGPYAVFADLSAPSCRQ